MVDSFFRDVAPRPIAEDEPVTDMETPAWMGPPWHRSPGSLLLNTEIGRSDTTVILIDTLRVYDEGFVLRLTVRFADRGLRARQEVFEYLERAHGRGRQDERFAADGLRWGISFADGRTVTTQDESPWAAHGDMSDMDVPGPVLEDLGRSTVFADTWSRDFWVWPLPPAPTLRVGVEWRSRGINETVTVIETAPIIHAAACDRRLWGPPD